MKSKTTRLLVSRDKRLSLVDVCDLASAICRKAWHFRLHNIEKAVRS